MELQYQQRDGYKLVGQGLATLVRVAQSQDLKHALEAGRWLVEYGENLMRETKAAKLKQNVLSAKPDRAEIIRELQGLYAKALGDGGLIVETTAEEPVSTHPPHSRD